MCISEEEVSGGLAVQLCATPPSVCGHATNDVQIS